jgi:hypothetical protein
MQRVTPAKVEELVSEEAAVQEKETQHINAPNSVDDVISTAVWPLIISLPLSLTVGENYKTVFPSEWYDVSPRDFWVSPERPSPLGLTLGILAVVVGQCFTLAYFVNRKLKREKSLQSIQKRGAPPYELWEAICTHLAQPEGFVMLGGYLIGKSASRDQTNRHE